MNKNKKMKSREEEKNEMLHYRCSNVEDGQESDRIGGKRERERGEREREEERKAAV